MVKLNNWTYEKCKEESLKYLSRFEFCKNSKSAYSSALNNNWLDEICVHMGDKKIKRNFWDYETCKIESMKYKTKSEFFRKSNYVYDISRKNKWLNVFY